MSKIIDANEFSRVTREELDNFTKSKIEEFQFEYQEVSDDEQKFMIEFIKGEIGKNLPASGQDRRADWENGWLENRKLLEDNNGISSLIPRYFGKFPLVRWDGRIVRTISKNFEYNMLVALELQVFGRLLKNSSKIYELGCGTGHNLLRARAVNLNAKITGLDWTKSSQEILKRLNDLNLLDCNARNFDFFNPDTSLDLAGASVYSVAALEQIGSSHGDLINFLIEKSPEICIHLEPIVELMDKKNELDKLCADYCAKRNYLFEFLTKLRQLRDEGKIEILEEKRNSIGSLFIEGYSLVTWRPVKGRNNEKSFSNRRVWDGRT